MDGEIYPRLLFQYFLPILPTFFENTIFRKDRAPAHYSSQLSQLLDASLHGSWIARGGTNAWPSFSPDFMPLDIFTWGFVKEKVYHSPCPNLTQLKRITTSAICSTTTMHSKMYGKCSRPPECNRERKWMLHRVPVWIRKKIDTSLQNYKSFQSNSLSTWFSFVFSNMSYTLGAPCKIVLDECNFFRSTIIPSLLTTWSRSFTLSFSKYAHSQF